LELGRKGRVATWAMNKPNGTNGLGKGRFVSGEERKKHKEKKRGEKEMKKCSRLSIICMWINHRTLESFSY
jgi:hypothetical protein